MNTRHVTLAVVALAVAATAGADNGWPREIATDRGTLVIYQPQIDRIKQRIIEGRAAVSFAARGTDEPIFGAFWFKAFLETDLDRRMATLASIQVPRVRFPGATEQKIKEAGAFLEQEILKLNIPISLDRVSAVQEELAEESRNAAAFKHDPPKIVIAREPTMLLLFDGAPILRDIEGHAGVLQRVANTPLPVVLDAKGKKYYLVGGETWYAARDPLGPWSPTTEVPAALTAMKAEADRRRQQQEEGESPATAGATATPAAAKPAGKPPKVLVATEPTELIVVFGEPTWAAVEGTELQYVSNTQGNVLRDAAGQNVYVLLSGRWYQSSSLEGPWAFVPPGSLPRAFARIPDTSPVASVLASVPGTSAARDALLDAQIPQTAAIRRDAAAPDVSYDGEPEFKPIEGTSLHYAVNTSFSVIRVGERYYCCHQAVWYAAVSPQGPWEIADQVPDDVYSIPPSNPHYNTTYVHVYDSTPEVVYTGYYPGYVNSYVYGGCVVYGTGWYYPPYVGPHFYYPWYPTWGMSVGYNPWTGWGYGVSWSSGPVTFSVSVAGWGGYYGWYGPYGYRPPYYPYPPRPGVPPAYRPPGAGIAAGARPGAPGVAPHSNNLYASGQNRGRNAAAPGNTSAAMADRVARGGSNNVFADRNGDVYRRNNDGTWQQRGENGWSRPEARQGSYQGPSSLERDYQARQHGGARAGAYQGNWGGSARGFGGGRRR